MIADYLRRGVAAGAVAGIAYGLYIVLVGNPLTEYAHDAGHGHDHGHEQATQAISETTAALVSAGSGLLWAIFLGGCFAAALYLFEPALPGSNALRPYVLAGAGFVTVSGVPWLALPPAAPGAEHLYGVQARLAAYLGLVALGAITVAATVAAYNRFAARNAGFGIAVAAAPLLTVAVVLTLAAPTVTTHPDLPADFVSAYRGLALLSQAVLWLLLAGAFDGLRRRAPIRSNDSTPINEGALAD